jgi:NAD(P)-dependent dehydrogenase (short-subunit alcohol dehydrogenase family)
MSIATSTSPIQPERGLLGQTVVVIGGSAGIGLETARRAHAEGAKLILAARNPERLEHASPFEAKGPHPVGACAVRFHLVLRESSARPTSASMTANPPDGWQPASPSRAILQEKTGVFAPSLIHELCRAIRMS